MKILLGLTRHLHHFRKHHKHHKHNKHHHTNLDTLKNELRNMEIIPYKGGSISKKKKISI